MELCVGRRNSKWCVVQHRTVCGGHSCNQRIAVSPSEHCNLHASIVTTNIWHLWAAIIFQVNKLNSYKCGWHTTKCFAKVMCLWINIVLINIRPEFHFGESTKIYLNSLVYSVSTMISGTDSTALWSLWNVKCSLQVNALRRPADNIGLWLRHVSKSMGLA